MLLKIGASTRLTVDADIRNPAPGNRSRDHDARPWAGVHGPAGEGAPCARYSGRMCLLVTRQLRAGRLSNPSPEPRHSESFLLGKAREVERGNSHGRRDIEGLNVTA